MCGSPEEPDERPLMNVIGDRAEALCGNLDEPERIFDLSCDSVMIHVTVHARRSADSMFMTTDGDTHKHKHSRRSHLKIQ